MGYPLRWVPAVVTLFGVVFFQAAANLLNDCYDHKHGLDTEVNPVSGVVVRALIAEKQAFRGALLFLALGITCGLYLVAQAGWVVLLLGVIGSLFAVAYTRGGWCLKYIGLGDVTIFCSFGVLPVFGAFYVQAGIFSWAPFLWSVPLTLLTVGILHANNWRDNQSDPAKGCRTVASMLGDRGSAIYYRLLILGPFALVLVYFAVGLLPGVSLPAPPTVFLALLALPPAAKLIKNSRNKYAEGDRVSFLGLDGQTARVHTIFGALLTLAIFIAKRMAQ